jgi:hypothetical protein
MALIEHHEGQAIIRATSHLSHNKPFAGIAAKGEPKGVSCPDDTILLFAAAGAG